jgi:hypothetical protein
MTQTMRPKPATVTVSDSVTKFGDDAMLQEFIIINQNTSNGHVIFHLA